MIRQQISGYEAEIWPNNEESSIFVAAGNLEQCKMYMKILIEQGATDTAYYIISDNKVITWNSLKEGWEEKPW